MSKQRVATMALSYVSRSVRILLDRRGHFGKVFRFSNLSPIARKLIHQVLVFYCGKNAGGIFDLGPPGFKDYCQIIRASTDN